MQEGSERYLRRRRDKERFVLCAGLATVMVALTAWWIIPVHTFRGHTVLHISEGRGIHVGDLPAAVFALVAVGSAWAALRALDRLTS